MSPSRTERSIRNIFVGILLQGFTTIFSFVTRTCLIKWIGVGAVGLNGLFSEVIGMISMAEMGVGAAIVYNLYAPLAANDTQKISQLMNLYKKAYRVIALATFVIGCALTPFIQHIVKKVDYSTGYIQTVFFLFVCNSSVSYLFSYKFSLLNADQKRYIQSLITLCVRFVLIGVRVAVLYFTRNYVAFLLVTIADTIIINLIGSWYVDRHYPYLRGKDRLPKDEQRNVFKNVGYIFIKKLSGVITNSTDNILISTLVDTLQVGLYSNYTVVYSAIRQGLGQVSMGINGSMGNLLASESEEQCAQTLRKVTFVFFCLGFPGAMCLFSGVDTVVRLWLGEEYVIGRMIVFLTCIIVSIDFVKTPLWQLLEVSGLFRRDMWISIAGSTVNLIVSVLLGKSYGMIGIFIGTIFSYAIQIVFKILLLYRYRFHLSATALLMDWLGYIAVLVFGLYGMEKLRTLWESANILVRLVGQVGTAGVLSLTAIVILWGRGERFQYTKGLVFRLLRRKNKNGM